MRTFNYVALVAGDMSGDVISKSILLNAIVLVSVQCVWTGSPVGGLKLQASNDGITWSDVAGSAVSLNGAGDVLYNLPEIGYLYLRAIYTHTSGAGYLQVVANGKGV